jgi:CD109 antigen
MIRFTWNLYALHYMSSAKNVKSIVPNIDQLVSSAKQNIIYMFERELRFSRKDGSFNIDNDSNDSGSTWLTAFILKSFVQAKQYLPDDIDDSVINKAAEFLRAQQKDDGGFEEKSPINDRSIRGGLSGRTPLTAYVISALIESKLVTKGNVRKALAYLEG